ncbi:MAG: hypothetical protein NZ480_00735 [Bdellovibrionaceae bacterium]|nr:hypothetical protein [Pseudobdellovibrionaceae bacterium]MDW8191119.1 CFI-box-CTERM domain-containing protein [Pseudobdellovibrionaceae bacterium]
MVASRIIILYFLYWVLFPGFIFLNPLRSLGQAEQKLISFSNYFNRVVQVGNTTYNVYAGNTANTCSGDGNSPCNSCNPSVQLSNPSLLTTGFVCNSNQFYPSLKFAVTMASSDANAYPAGCTYLLIGLNGNTLVSPTSVSSYTPNTPKQNVTATWTWSTICQAFSGNQNCKKSFKNTLRVGFNANCGNTNVLNGYVDFIIHFRYVNNSPFMSFGCPGTMGPYEGFCDYTVFPGDGKIYLSNQGANLANNLAAGDQQTNALPVQATSADPSGIKYYAVRAFYDQGGFNNVTLGSPYVDLEIDPNSGLRSPRITGLINGQVYSVIVANKDEAGNLELFAHPQNPSNNPAMSDSVTPVGETQAAIPEVVRGLIEDERCFIATAAFGDANDPQVKILRNFRDHFLLKYSWGRSFVEWYYKVSPTFAQQIKNNHFLRMVTRTLLWPVTMLLRPLYGQTPNWPAPEEFKKAHQEIQSGKDEIDHPLEKQGLVRINRDGSYDYAVALDTRQSSLSFSFERIPKLDIKSSPVTFPSLYSSSTMSFIAFSFEWLPFDRLKKQLSVRWSLGIGQDYGSGYMPQSGLTAEEGFNLLVVPLNARLFYKWDFWDRQIIVPTIGTGIGYLGLFEIRDDSAKTNLAGAFFTDLSGGIQISVRRINPRATLSLKRDYGINDFWIFGELRQFYSLKNSIDFTGNQFVGGLTIDF